MRAAIYHLQEEDKSMDVTIISGILILLQMGLGLLLLHA